MQRSAIVFAVFIFIFTSAVFSQASLEARELTLKGIKHYEAGNLEVALEALTKAIEVSSKPKRSKAVPGNALVEQTEEERLRDRISFHDPITATAYLNRGHVQFARAKMDLAIADYSRSIEIRPGKPEPYSYRSVAKLLSRRVAEAVDDAKRAIKIDPKFIHGYIALSMSYIETGRNEEAWNTLDRAIGIDPNSAEIYLRRGDLHRLAKRYNDALSDYDRAIKLNPELPSSYVGRGAIRFDQGRFDEAIEQYSIALDLDTRLLQARRFRAYAYLAIGKDSEAERDLSRVLSVAPQFREEIEQAKSEIYGWRKVPK